MHNAALITVLAFLAACSVGDERTEVSDTQEVLSSSDATMQLDAEVERELLEPSPDVDTPDVASAASELPIEQTRQPTTSYMLRRGETLAHFARWSELAVEDIAETSNLDLGGSYEVGTEVKVAIEGEALAELDRRRELHRTVRVEGYLTSRGGAAGTDFHKVRTGETAWNIAKQHQAIPVWVLEAYNPTVDLERLRPGQELMVPVLADVVADLGEVTAAGN